MDSKTFRKASRSLAKSSKKMPLLCMGVQADEIDRINILQASLVAMQRVLNLPVMPHKVLVDGNHCPN